MPSLDEMQERERKAVSLLGGYSIKTAGGLLVSTSQYEISGWLYANTRNLVFLAEAPLSPVLGRRPEVHDEYTILMPLPGRPHKLTAPFIAPNGIIDFGGGLEFVGAKKQIKAIAAACGS